MSSAWSTSSRGSAPPKITDEQAAELAERRIGGWPGDTAVRDYLLTWVSAW